MVSLPGPDGEGNEACTVGLEIGDFVFRRESGHQGTGVPALRYH
jgi:hypothetical protein